MMHASVGRLASKRKKSSHGIGKSGDELLLAGRSEDRAKDYIGEGKTPLPEKFAFHDKPKDNRGDREKSKDGASDRFDTIDRSVFSKDKPPIRSSGKFELDTGWVELGCDKGEAEGYPSGVPAKKSREERGAGDGKDESAGKKSPDSRRAERNTFDRKLYVSYQSNCADDDARRVKEAKAKERRINPYTFVKGNDESFSTGAEYLETSQVVSSKQVGKMMEKFSSEQHLEGTYDDVVPFHNSDKQRDQLQELRASMNKQAKDKTDTQKTVTAVQTYKNRKDAMKLDFDKKFTRQIENIKLDNKVSSGDSDLWFFLLNKKKFLEEEQSQVSDNPNDDNLDDVLDGASDAINQKNASKQNVSPDVISGRRKLKRGSFVDRGFDFDDMGLNFEKNKSSGVDFSADANVGEDSGISDDDFLKRLGALIGGAAVAATSDGGAGAKAATATAATAGGEVAKKTATKKAAAKRGTRNNSAAKKISKRFNFRRGRR